MQMAEQETEVDEDESTEYEQRAWTRLSPPAAITGTFADIATAATIDSTVEDTGFDFGIQLESPEVAAGDLFVNNEHEAGGIVSVADDEPRPSDFRIVGDRDDHTIISGVLASDEVGPNEYSEGEFDVDETMAWVGGVAGQYIGRALDRHGTPYARTWSDGGESGVVKGLIQVPDGWRVSEHGDDVDIGEVRAELVSQGLTPRVARPAYARPDLQGEEITVTIRKSGGRSYLGSVFRTDELPDEGVFTEGDDGAMYIHEDAWDAVVDPMYDDDFDTFVAENEVPIAIHTGDDWCPNLDNWPDFHSLDSSGGSGSSTSISADQQTDESTASADRQAVIDGVVDALEDVGGVSPDGQDGNPAAFESQGGLRGVVESELGDVSDDELEEIRERVYQQTSFLDSSDL